ncbi:MAG: hypothetical protein LC107_00905 [Chitinophagales bacterium]|nr:hypothetical protein [Chitinophagales bacterium]
MQFKAAYIVDSVAKHITEYKNGLNPVKENDFKELNKIEGLLQYVSSFDVEFGYEYKPDFKEINPVISVINNIITRGLPTRASLLLEETFVEIGLTQPNVGKYEFNYPNSNVQLNYEIIFELLHIIEPALKIDKNNYGGNLDSNLEWEFIKQHPFLIQILESQRDFSSINSKLKGDRRVDFSFQSPYLYWDDDKKSYKRIGRIFEVDGHQNHFNSQGIYYDKYRDAMADDEDFKSIRFTEESIITEDIPFETLIDAEIYKIFNKNFNRDITDFKQEYLLIFIPLAVARIQKTILETLITKPELLDKKKISLAVIERDFPCGAIAVESLNELFLNVNSLLEDGHRLTLPEIDLTIFPNHKWDVDNRIHRKTRVGDEEYFNNNMFDVILDHSILRRSNIYKEKDFKHHQNNIIKIRSSHFNDRSFGMSRRVYSADLLKYQSLVTKNDNGTYDSIVDFEDNINYFIQNIFRKVSFKEGQLPIISRAIQLKPVIGLLPTGGGKSLTYQ